VDLRLWLKIGNRGGPKYGNHLPCVHKRQAVCCTLPECPLALHEHVCRVGLLMSFGNFKEENLYRAAVIRVMQCTVVIVMKVYMVFRVMRAHSHD
jgi:hypothetical protein